MSIRPNESVYEYRSGRLIKGILNKQGDFIPDLGKNVISFKEYHYSPQAIRIYNLPGSFEKKGSKEEKQKEK